MTIVGNLIIHGAMILIIGPWSIPLLVFVYHFHVLWSQIWIAPFYTESWQRFPSTFFCNFSCTHKHSRQRSYWKLQKTRRIHWKMETFAEGSLLSLQITLHDPCLTQNYCIFRFVQFFMQENFISYYSWNASLVIRLSELESIYRSLVWIGTEI